MCGILYVKFKKDFNEGFEDIFKVALEKMHYRGRDNIDYLRLDNHFFGHARLSIIDTSNLSNQPIYNDKYAMLFNGEIYNYKDIDPHAISDTLMLFALLKAKGNIPIIELLGMYALLVYDREKDETLIYRDFYGEKPLYYYNDDNIFIASSTISSIVYILKETYGMELLINHQALYEYLLFGFIREPITIYQGIHMLESACQLKLTIANELIISNNAEKIINKNNFNSLSYITKCFSATDVKPLLLLSGGVDSGFILNIVQCQKTPFSVLIYKSPDQQQDESTTALAHLHRICGDNLPEYFVVSNSPNQQDLFSEFPKLLEQPSSDGINLLNILAECRRIGNHQKLILTGLGGDELYGGYHSFKNYFKYKLFKKFKWIKRLLPIKYHRFFVLKDGEENTSVEAYYFQYRLCHKTAAFIDKDIIHTVFLKFLTNIQKYSIKKDPSAKYKIKVCDTMDN